ncbi:hypothetical protein [Hellea balneolensis]|uniref:hypothetical protein n=1 Tax=Hellea balneolensis TaxID=287478 RepID=UPI0003F988B6|nr:hypothetical protein [Hellea balneolensis]
MFKRLSIFCSFLALSACETIPVTPEDVSLINNQEKSVILASYYSEKEDVCYHGYLNLMNVDTRKVYSLGSFRGSNIVKPTPGRIAVAPGTYRIASGTCVGYQVSANLPLIQTWFEDFEINPGEVVNIGRLKPVDFDLKSLPKSQLGRAVNVLFSLGSRANETTYVTYSFDAENESYVKALLDKKYPEIQTKHVTRLPKLRFSEDEFKAVLIKAHEANSDGEMPTSEQARERVAAGLSEFMEQRK